MILKNLASWCGVNIELDALFASIRHTQSTLPLNMRHLCILISWRSELRGNEIRACMILNGEELSVQHKPRTLCGF
jgi:hypothetical protein